MKIFTSKILLTFSVLCVALVEAFADPDLFTVTVTGGNSFKISRTDASAASYVYYYTQSGSAVADIHYTDVSGTLEFPQGIKEKTITVAARTVSDGDKYVSGSRSRDFFFVIYNNSINPLFTQGYVSGWTNYSYSTEKTQKICDGFLADDDNIRKHDGVATLASAFTDDERSYFTNTNQTPKYKFNVSFKTYEVDDGYYYMGIYFNSESSNPWKATKVAATPNGQNANLYNVCWERNGKAGTLFTIKLPVRGLSTNGNVNSYVWCKTNYWDIGNTNDYLYNQYFNSSYSDMWSSSDGYFLTADGSKKISIITNAAGEDDDSFWVKEPTTNVKLWDDVNPVVKGISVNTAHTYTSGERVYLAVRFNEVVDHHVSSATVTIGSNSYSFSYVGGDYTTTLYFCCDNITTTSTSGITGNVTLKSIGGYVKDMNGNSTYLSDLSYSVSGFKMYPSYAVTLNTNGGTINGGNVTKYTYKVGATLPTNVTRPGYTFGGWYTNSSCTGTAVTEISTSVSGAKTYYAKWTPITYTITYNLAGGAQANPKTSYTVETSTFTLVNPTRTGYTFAGWTGSNGTTAQTSVSIAKGSTGDKTYTANWNANKYYIGYNGSGNTSGTMSNTTCTYDVSATLRNNAFVKTGYTFLGWATTASASSATFTNQQSVSNLTSVSGQTINLYAVWSAKKFTVSLDQTGASTEGTTTVEATYNTALPVITPPTRIGYGFEGFFTQQNGEGNQYYKSDGVPSVTSYQYDGNLILYAKWTERDYTITYYNAGGTITTENPTTSYSYGTTVTLPSIQKNGCTFGGWYNNPNYTGDAVTQISSTEYGDKSLYAKWEPITYTVTLNKNGGDIKNGSDVESYVFGVGAILPTAQNMERSGFTFAGWYNNSGCTGDAISSITVADYGNKEFWAKWEEGGYVVTLQTNGGTINSGNVVSYIYLTGAVLPTDVTKTGYTFAGWYENSSCLGTPVTEISTSDQGDKSYWAKWTENVYNVTFHENEGTINNNVVVETYTFTVGAALPTDVTRKGYSFGGWFNNEECTGNPITLISTTEYGDKEFWADWNIVTYSITFNNNGGVFENQVIPEHYQLGDNVVLPTDISREGYTFDGWYDNSNFTNTKVTTIEDDEVGNKVFYAKWLVNSYNITLETNGGTINSGNVTNYTYGYGISLPSDVTKLGYSFAGWYADEEFATARLTRISETVSGNQTFYAKWTENTYSITLNVNEGTINEDYMSYYTFGTGTSLPSNVTRHGYSFMGWFVNSNFDGSAVESVLATDYGDKAYWAKWQVEKYDVTLQTNGGTINSGNLSGYTFGVGAILPTDITKVGHTFAGWYASEEFNSAELSVIAVNETGDKTFYAKWNINDYSVQLNANGGIINDNDINIYTYGVGAELPADVVRSGYTFAGWYGNSNMTGEEITEISSTEYGNKSYWAKWNTNLYTVEFDVNGGTINTGNIASYLYGTDVILPTDVTRYGYTFAGWHIVAQDQTQEDAVAILQINASDVGDKTFYAWWTENTYTIKYNAIQGTINQDYEIGYTYGTSVQLPTDVTREGHRFIGWYTNDSYLGDPITAISVTDIGNKEFWAKWDVNTYTVSLDAKGGDINSGNLSSYTYNVLTILPQDVTKVGYTFEGWFDSENQKVTQISKGTIGNVTFTAKWTAKTYNVTLQTNNGTINSGNVTSYTYGLGATLPEDVTKTGYEFLGWFDNSSYDGGKVTKIADNEIGNKNFWAKWTAASYDVTLDADGGTVNANSIEEYTYGVGAILPTDVTKIGYTFKGWKDGDDNDVLEISTADYGDKTFTAQWEQADYAITYNANGGSINESYETTYNYGEEITLATDVTKEGNEFAGWYDNSNFSGEAVTAIPQTAYGDKTFYAKWNANTYDVTFKTNGGTINSGEFETYTYGVVASLPTNVTKDGYTFTGWYSDEECTGAVVSIISSNTFGNQTFFAGWSNTAYAVTLNTNDGVISAGNVTSYTFGTAVALPNAEQITKTGYTFGGWYDNSSCTGTAQTEISAEATGNKSFWAKWTVNTYDVTLETNGGTINSGNVTNYTFGVGVNLPGDVAKTGHTFAGWYDNAEFTGDRQTRIDEYALGAKTFYANWTANEYTITYEVAGGSIEDANYKTAYTFGNETTLPATVSKAGHKFAGWFTNSAFEGSAVAGISATEYGNKTFYAKWNVNTYKVTLNANDGSINNGNILSYTYGVGATLPTDVTKTGYTFNGWFDNDEFAGEAITSIANNEIGDKTFYAKWTVNSYAVTLNANGGEIAGGNVTEYEFGTGAALPTTVTKTGYTFAGWYDNANLTGEVFTAIANNVTGAKSFYAKWNVNTYRVTLNANEGSINNGNVTNYVYGSTVVLPSDITKTGYTFAGWYDNDEFAGEAITSIANNETGDKTFYAKFTVNTYNVILVTNEGVINSGNIESYEFGKGATLPTDVTKTGYTFGGWYGNTSYIGGTVSSIADNDMGDKQFWAKWTINEYEVAATAENGTVEGTGSYEYKSTATLKAIANEGYEFVGWNDGELKDERIQLTVTKDTTLTANFKEKEKVQISGTLEIPTLKTEREAQPIDLNGLFTTTEGGEVTYSAASSAPNVVAATVSEGKLFLTVYEYEGEAEITVTATLPNGEKNTVKATATVVLACNIQVAETIKNVSCYGESDGEIALKVTNAAEPYTTQWQGQTSTEDTLRNVTANAYTVVISDAENCSFTKTYSVTEPEEMKLSAKIKNPTCDNADGSITITLTGAENASFAWSNDATTQNVASLEKGDYSLVVTNTETGCQISDNFTLVEPESPVVTVSNVVETACNESAGAVTISANEDGLLYNWSNNKHTKNLTNVPAGDYTLSVVNPETNCTATLEVTVPSIKLKQPEIALVTVSEQTGKNLVVWLKENTDLIQRYNIYRESETANVYTKIAEVPYSELSVYEDLEANPAVTAWRYKISATDVCNEETELGEYHKTIHLMQNQGLGGVYNLDWNTYEGLDFPTYVVIRKSVVRKVVTMDTIAYLSSNNNTYTDTLPAKGTQAYYVGMVLPEEINPMTQFMKAESGPFSIALSNIAEVENGDVPVYSVVESKVEVYAKGHTIYVKDANESPTALYDVKGRKIDFAKGQNDYTFNVALDGVYFINVDGKTLKVLIK